MSLIIGKGICLTYFETEIKCPICEQIFDASEKMDKAKYPVFNTMCPKCKGKITISIPVFGGVLKCWETNCPPSVKRLETETPNKINGIIPKPPEPFSDDDNDDDSYETSEIFT